MINIGMYAFMGCENLRSVTVPNSVSFGGSSFRECVSINNVTITPNGGNATNVKNRLIANGCPSDITWNLPPKHTITFNSNEGTSVLSGIYEYKESITPPANPTRTGYTFAGWSPEIPSTMPNNDITCTAQWSINQYTVTWNGNGGTPSRSSDTLNFNS